MKIKILHLIDGAKQAEGLTVIIDVFRAFSLECYLYAMGAKEIRPAGTIEEAFRLKNRFPDSVLIGERQGKKCDGFDYGNSPSSIPKEMVNGKTVIHTTSAGTQGIVHAQKADEILTGSLVNAKAVADYILQRQPERVSLVCMGKGGVRPTVEDTLCAEYIKSLLEGNGLPDLEQRIDDLRKHGGQLFFDKERQRDYPEGDFWMCVKYDQFPFVLRIDRDQAGFTARKIYAGGNVS